MTTSARGGFCENPGGGFPRTALCAASVMRRSARKSPTPTGKRKNEMAQMTLANSRIHSCSSSSSSLYSHSFTVGEYIREPTMPMRRPRMLRMVPTKRYRPLQPGA